jgi:hypothetical protein
LDNKFEVIVSQVGAILGVDTSKAMIKQFEARAARVRLQDKMAGVRIELKDAKQLQVGLPALFQSASGGGLLLAAVRRLL